MRCLSLPSRRLTERALPHCVVHIPTTQLPSIHNRCLAGTQSVVCSSTLQQGAPSCHAQQFLPPHAYAQFPRVHAYIPPNAQSSTLVPAAAICRNAIAWASSLAHQLSSFLRTPLHLFAFNHPSQVSPAYRKSMVFGFPPKAACAAKKTHNCLEAPCAPHS